MTLAVLLWSLEQSLRLSHKLEKLSGWVPYDEPRFEIQKSFQHSNPTSMPQQSSFNFEPSLSKSYDSPSHRAMLYDNIKTRIHRESPIMHVRERLRQMYQTVSPQPQPPPRTGVRVEESGSVGIPVYQSITAEEENQAKSFEELRLDHYQEQEQGAQAEQSPRAEQSLLDKSLSCLTNSFLGNSSTHTPDHGPLLVDGAEEVDSSQVVPNLLTRTPGKQFT